MPNLAKNQSLSELANRMLIRLGYASQGQGAAFKVKEMHEYLQSAQRQLLADFPDHLMSDVYLDDSTQEGQVLYDFEDYVDTSKVYKVMARKNSTDTWRELSRGIPSHHRLNSSYTGEPTHYEIRFGTSNTSQLELFPYPDASYQFGYEFQRLELPFKEDHHLSSFDSESVFLFALANAMEAHNHPSYKSVAAQTQKMLYSLRVGSNRGVKVSRGSNDTSMVRSLADRAVIV